MSKKDGKKEKNSIYDNDQTQQTQQAIKRKNSNSSSSSFVSGLRQAFQIQHSEMQNEMVEQLTSGLAKINEELDDLKKILKITEDERDSFRIKASLSKHDSHFKEKYEETLALLEVANREKMESLEKANGAEMLLFAMQTDREEVEMDNALLERQKEEMEKIIYELKIQIQETELAGKDLTLTTGSTGCEEDANVTPPDIMPPGTHLSTQISTVSSPQISRAIVQNKRKEEDSDLEKLKSQVVELQNSLSRAQTTLMENITELTIEKNERKRVESELMATAERCGRVIVLLLLCRSV